MTCSKFFRHVLLYLLVNQVHGAAWGEADGGTAGVGDCFLDLDYEEKTQKSCDSCCGACTQTTDLDNYDSEGCICTVLGDGASYFEGSAYNDCIFIAGNNNDNIWASTPASKAVEERLPFPRAERGPMPPGAPKSERVRDPAS